MTQPQQQQYSCWATFQHKWIVMPSHPLIEVCVICLGQRNKIETVIDTSDDDYDRAMDIVK